jgi:FkbM family methyltransferase
MYKKHKRVKYWLVHDPKFLKFANLKFFNKKILNYSLKEESDYLIKYLYESPINSVFLDIGAYNGNTCIEIAKSLKEKDRSDIQIIAFEPVKKLSDYINRISDENGYNLKCINIVVSNKKGTIYNKIEAGPCNMFNTQYNGIPYKSDILDDILQTLNIDTVFLMKIDTEGHEVEVLDGATNILKNTKYIYIEVWNDLHLPYKNAIINGSHNKNIVQKLYNFYPIQKIEKNIFFKSIN